jgi:hypothetical protein
MDTSNEYSLLEYLIKIGAVKKIFNNSSYEDEFVMTNKCDKFIPELPKKFSRDFQEEIFTLWQLDLLDILFDQEGKHIIKINNNSFNSETIKELSIETVVVLRQVISALNKA